MRGKQCPPSLPIVIDEIQLVPELVEEVHHLIETTDYRFLLTGSSPRKLKIAGANLLGGRARLASFFPLTWHELEAAGSFDFEKYLKFGGMPESYLSDDPTDWLSDYVDGYLDTEIKAEAVTRNLSGFERFLQRVASMSSEVVVLQSLAGDIQLSPPTVRQYLEVLEDTLLGFYLRPWQSPNRKAIQSAKFYFFDLGVQSFLTGIDQIPRSSNLFGRAFEHFIIHEVRTQQSYKRTRNNLFFWRTQRQQEVDLIVGDSFAVEIKASNKTKDRDAKSLKLLKDEGFKGELFLVSLDELDRQKEGVQFLHWKTFFKGLWS